MTVRNFLNKMNMSSNCIVYVFDCDARKEHHVFYDEIKAGAYGEFDDMRVNSFTVRNDTLTLYVERI